MWAAGGCDRNLALAEWANRGGWRCWRFWLFAERNELVHSLQEQEENEGHDKEIDQFRNKAGCKTSYILQCVGFSAGHKVQDRVDKVIRQGSDDAGERTADDNTDGHVHHVAAERKGFKFFDKVFDLTTHVIQPFPFKSF